MKKIILLLIAAAAIQSTSAQTTNAQRVKRLWVDLQLAQHIGLDRWSDLGYANDGFPSASITEIRAVGNIYFAKPLFGAFLDMGFGIMPAPAMRSFDLSRAPMPNSGTQYYLREMILETGADKPSAQFRIATGLFANFRAAPKFDVMPYLGIGGITMPSRSYQMILKEQGSNNEYHTTFMWGLGSGDTYEYASDSPMLGFLTARMMFKYKFSRGASFLFGLEYTGFFQAMYFSGRYTNTFNGNVQRRFSVEGNRMSMLGLSVGISFM